MKKNKCLFAKIILLLLIFLLFLIIYVTSKISQRVLFTKDLRNLLILRSRKRVGTSMITNCLSNLLSEIEF